MKPLELALLQQALAEVSKHPETQTRIFKAICDAVYAIEMDGSTPPTPEAEPVQQDTKPAFWVLTEQLQKRETTHRGYMWFVNPQNSAWTPVYLATPPAEKQAAPSGEGEA